MSGNAAHLPDASDIGLSISLFRRATPLWLVYSAKLAGENVVAWRLLPSHLRGSNDGSAVWPKLPDWLVAGDVAADKTGVLPRLAAYSHKSASGWLVYPVSAKKALDKPISDRKMLADLANHLLTALDMLHGRETLHLDVHPANVSEMGGHFALNGLGVDVRKQTGAATGRNEGLARKGYGAPEMWDASGRSKLGPWTDIFAAAATLYFAICGKAPPDFRERIDKPRWREAVTFDLNRELSKSGTAWPKMVEFIIAGLAPKIEDRPKTVSEWSRIWKEPVPPTTGLPLTASSQTPQSPMIAKHPMLFNAGMGALGVIGGGILFFFWLGTAVPVLLELAGMGSYQVKSGYGPSQAFLLFQLLAVLAVDIVLPRLGGFGRSGFLLPAILAQLVMTNNDWREGSNWVDWFNVAAFVVMLFSLAENKSEARSYFVKYTPVLLLIGAALSYWDIRNLIDLGL